MTNQEYQVLSILASSDLPVPDPAPETLKTLTALRAKGLVSCDITGEWYINDSGIAALSQAKEIFEKAAKEISNQHAQEEKAELTEKRKERREWFRFFLGLFIGWILGVISPLNVWSWIMSLFH